MRWEAGIEYDEGRLGHICVFGLKSREEAIAWLSAGFNWNRCWYLLPSCWLREQRF